MTRQTTIMSLNPRESGEFVVKRAKFLKVRPAGIACLAKRIMVSLKDKTLDPSNFSQHEHHPKPTDKDAIDWLFLIDALNFCFWTPSKNIVHYFTGKDSTKWRIEENTGYFALCAGINRAKKEGMDISNPKVYGQLTREQVDHIFRSDDGKSHIPLIEERVQCLQEASDKLLNKYDGSFENCIKSCDRSAQKLLNLVVSEFPAFRDEADYKGQRVSLYKRAQILIGDIWACFQGQGLGQFDDIDTLTMFADYRVPQVLVAFGALEYTPELLDALKKNEILKNGDEREVEIRAASIYIVEELKKLILEQIKNNHPQISSKNVNSVLLDHFLWDYRRSHAQDLETVPFHKTFSVYY